MDKKGFSVLKNTNFRLLTMGQFISTFGDSMYLAAILWFASLITGSSASVSIIAVLDMLPAILLGTFLGTIVDRHVPTQIMVLADCARAVCVIGVLVAFTWGELSIGVIYLVTFLMAVFQALYNPAQFSVIPQILPKDLIQQGNSVSSLSQNVSMTIGNFIVGFLWKLLGGIFIFAFNVVSFIFSAICECKIYSKSAVSKENKKQQVDKNSVRYLINESVEGIKYMVKKPAIVSAMVVGITTNATCGSVILMPLYIQKDFTSSIFLYGFVESAGALGMIIGAYLLMKFQIENQHQALIISGIFLTISFAIMALAHNEFILITGRFLYGVFNIMGNIAFSTHFQNSVEEQFRGRMYSISFMISSLSLPIMAFLGGKLADYIGIRETWLIISIPVFISFMANYIICKRGDWFKMEEVE